MARRFSHCRNGPSKLLKARNHLKANDFCILKSQKAVTPEAIKAAKDLKIEILALSPKQMYKDTYQGEEENFGKIFF